MYLPRVRESGYLPKSPVIPSLLKCPVNTGKTLCFSSDRLQGTVLFDLTADELVAEGGFEPPTKGL